MHVFVNLNGQRIKVIQYIRSLPGVEAYFTRPYLNDAKKLLLEVSGFLAGNYLYTFVGKNIKRVTWEGEDVQLPPHDELFQSGFATYGDDDTNETEGDYDVYNSGVSIVHKAGPIDQRAKYCIEFKKEPSVKEPINLYIACQGMGDFDTIGPFLSDAVSGADVTTCNDFNNEEADYIEPALNNATFTPIPLSRWAMDGDVTLNPTFDCSLYTTADRTLELQLGYLPVGKYRFMLVAIVDSVNTASSTHAQFYPTVAVTDFQGTCLSADGTTPCTYTCYGYFTSTNALTNTAATACTFSFAPNDYTSALISYNIAVWSSED